jgi:hypothetical protein
MNRQELETSLEAIYLDKLVSINTIAAEQPKLYGRITLIAVDHRGNINIQIETGLARLRIPFKDTQDIENNITILTQNGNTIGESGGDVIASI